MMAQNTVYEIAEQKIEKARRSGAIRLDLRTKWDAKDSDKLTELPESLGQLIQLRELDLSQNQLLTLPEWLGKLTELQSLNLSFNQLMELPDSLGELVHLKVLLLHINELVGLPSTIRRLVDLSVLSLATTPAINYRASSQYIIEGRVCVKNRLKA